MKYVGTAALVLLTGFALTWYVLSLPRSSGSSFSLDQSRARKDLAEFVKEPHPLGSARQSALARFLHERLGAMGIKAEVQRFDAQVPIREDQEGFGEGGKYKRITQGYNVIGYLKAQSANSCVQMLGSHYDTKIIPGLRYVGANDSGSSSALLLQVAEFLKSKSSELSCDLAFVWFDGEESVLDDWNRAERAPYGQQDNTYGSRYFVSQLKVCGENSGSDPGQKVDLCLAKQMKKPIKELILLDMVGSPNLKISLDRLSSDRLVKRLQKVAADLGYKQHVSNSYTFVEDDHIPFRKAGIDAIDIIDFNNLDYWHKPGDEVAHLSLESIEIAGRIVAKMVLQK